MTLPNLLTKSEAKSLGYERLTEPYVISTESDELLSAAKQLAQGGVDYCIVLNGPTATLWRKGITRFRRYEGGISLGNCTHRR